MTNVTIIPDLITRAKVAEAERDRMREERAAVPPMPPTNDRRPYIEEEPDGYLEGDRDWCDANSDAVKWLIENHVTIRACLSPTDAQKKS